MSTKALEEKVEDYINQRIYLSLNDIENIANYCKDKFEEEVKDTLRIANDVINKTFKFEWKWDMERTFIPYTFKDEIIWDETPNGDDEWIFMLNRHRYWITLGQAYAITKDEKYAKTFFTQLKHWIKNVRPLEGTDKTTWRTIDAGIRCENWVKAFIYFKDSKYLEENLIISFIDSLIEHAKYLCENYKESSKLSNWGVLESHGLLVVGLLLPKLKESKKYIQLALERLEEQIDLQVMEDGIHWEQSPMYLNEVLHCYLDTIILCKNNGIEIPNLILEKTKKLAYANLYMAKPNHHQICQSDSDDTDLRDMVTKASYLFNDGILKFGGYDEIDFESVWDLGFSSLDTYKRINKIRPLNTSFGFEDSGNYYMRSGWKEEDSYLYFHCGTLGSGHGHADLLHFSLYANEEDYLIDPGRYTYIEGNKEREYLKSCVAHNTTTVDDRDFTILNGSWGYKKVATPIKHPFITKDSFDYCEGSHLGYLDIGVFTNRRIVYIKPDIWILIDEFYGDKDHEYKQYFHFAKDIYLEDEKTICKGKNGYLKLYHLNKLDRKIEKTPLSYHYNKIENQDTLVTNIKHNGFTSILTVMNANKDNSNLNIKKVEVKNCNGRVLEDNEAEAIKIEHKDVSYTLLICHNEIFKGKKLLKVSDYDVYGKVVLITEKENSITKEVIKY